MLSAEMIDKLNAQINLEFFSANLYLQMSSWCQAQSLNGCAGFMRLHAEEERGHMMRLFDYVNSTGGEAILGGIEAPQSSYKDISEVFKTTYKHEQLVTTKINELVGLAFSTQDFATFNFLQWYVEEQREEEDLFRSILERLKLIGLKAQGLYHFDKEMEALAAQHMAAASEA